MRRPCSSSRCSAGRADSGATLLEIMIASGLMLLIMGGIARLMTVGASYLSIQEVKAEISKDTTIAFLWLTRELRESDADSVKTAPNGVIFATPRDAHGDVVFDSAGRMLWHQNICYYAGQSQGMNALLRKSRLLAVPAISPPAVPSVDSLRLDTGAPTSVKARHVKSLTFDVTVSPMEMTLFSEATSSRGRTYGMELKTRVYFRN